jgi:hypothetical protein
MDISNALIVAGQNANGFLNYNLKRYWENATSFRWLFLFYLILKNTNWQPSIIRSILAMITRKQTEKKNKRY